MSLGLSYAELKSEVGMFLGSGRGNENGESDTAWTQRDLDKITSIVKSGLRNFYFPPPREGQSESYNWSFLRPVGTFTLASGERTILLPEDFGSPEGRATVTGANSLNRDLEFVGEGALRELYARDTDGTGSPLAVAMRPVKGTTHGRGQRFELFLYPAADADYTLQIAYYVNPDALSTERPYPYGGAVHSETILESCLAVAEQRLDDASSVHSAKFHERLAASISHDYKLKPQLQGRLGPQDGYQDRWSCRWHGTAIVTYNGVEY